MNNTLINKLVSATSFDEIISYKNDVLAEYKASCRKCCGKGSFLCKTNYNDIEALCNLESPMMAYFGPQFYDKCGFPFLMEKNSTTIKVIENAFWFYSSQIIKLAEDAFFNRISVCIHDELDERITDFIHTSFSEMKWNKGYLFIKMWNFFMHVILMKKKDTEIILYNETGCVSYYIDDSTYRTIVLNSFDSYINSDYEKIINNIIGIYESKFLPWDYISKYQPSFVKIAWHYFLYINIKT